MPWPRVETKGVISKSSWVIWGFSPLSAVTASFCGVTSDALSMEMSVSFTCWLAFNSAALREKWNSRNSSFIGNCCAYVCTYAWDFRDFYCSYCYCSTVRLTEWHIWRINTVKVLCVRACVRTQESFSYFFVSFASNILFYDCKDTTIFIENVRFRSFCVLSFDKFFFLWYLRHFDS